MKSLENLRAQLAEATARANQKSCERLPLDDMQDFEAAQCGKIAELPVGGVPAPGGRTAWNIADYDFLDGDCPDTVNPSLWRMAQLNKISGLFEVTDGVWQARACDYANMTIVRGDSGWILIDPLMTKQTSAAALQMVNETLGERPVSAIVLTHTHPDHFGGIKGVLGANPQAYPPIYAPAEFMTYAASEGIFGGNQMARRAIYQFGLTLPIGPEGTIDGGIGKSPAKGQRSFVAPQIFIEKTGETHDIDGVPFIFQMASGTEAPAEFTFMLPSHKVLCMAEVCSQTMHNALPPRGAQVRDTLLWARTIDEAIELFSKDADTLINCHNWPVWGKANVLTYLEEQRDIYKYIHDQSLRLANHGHTPNEIAEEIVEPDWLTEKFHARGYYGSLKFNARAVYQMYYGFYAHIVDAVGGVDAALQISLTAIERDDLQWAATLLSHVSPDATDEARYMLAEVYRHLGYREESGILRNAYLMGAKELSEGVNPIPMVGGRNEDLAAALGLQDWFDAYAIRLNPKRAKPSNIVLNFEVEGEMACVCVARQTEFTRINYQSDNADLKVTVQKQQLEALASGSFALADAVAQGVQVEGPLSLLQEWLDLHDTFDLWFNVVSP